MRDELGKSPLRSGFWWVRRLCAFSVVYFPVPSVAPSASCILESVKSQLEDTFQMQGVVSKQDVRREVRGIVKPTLALDPSGSIGACVHPFRTQTPTVSRPCDFVLDRHGWARV